MTQPPPSRARVDAREALRAHLHAHPDAVLERVAEEHGASLLDALRSLPPAMVVERDGAHFGEALAELATWGPVTTIVHTPDVILEFAGPFPSGSFGRGFYNLESRDGLGGHLRPERCARIAFLERLFMGVPTASVLFLNVDGGCMFKVFLRRDVSRAIDATQLDAFRALAGGLA